MRFFRVWLCVWLAVAFSEAFSGAGVCAGEDAPSNPRERILRAASAMVAKAEWLDESQRQAYAEALEQARRAPPPNADGLQKALQTVYPAFREAMAAYRMEREDAAAARFQALAGHADPYLATQAALHLAALAIRREEYEEALPFLDRILDERMDYHLAAPQLHFWRAQALAHVLRVEEAIRALEMYADALGGPTDDPARMRQAEALFARLVRYRESTVTEAELLMDYSRRRLHLQDPGEVTQARQEKILAILDATIKELEESRDDCQSDSGDGKGQGEDQGQQRAPAPGAAGTPAADSSLPDGGPPPGQLGRAFRGDPREVWGNLPEHERKEIENHLREQFPQRYREIIEEYFIILQKEAEE